VRAWYLLGVSLSGDAVLDRWCFARFLDRIFQARNGCEVVSSEKCPAGQAASTAGAAGAAVSTRCGMGSGTRALGGRELKRTEHCLWHPPGRHIDKCGDLVRHWSSLLWSSSTNVSHHLLGTTTYSALRVDAFCITTLHFNTLFSTNYLLNNLIVWTKRLVPSGY
jgi:hypothetical protein